MKKDVPGYFLSMGAFSGSVFALWDSGVIKCQAIFHLIFDASSSSFFLFFFFFSLSHIPVHRFFSKKEISNPLTAQ